MFNLTSKVLLRLQAEIMAKLFKTIRNNWKKSLFGTFALAYGIKYGKDKYEDSLIREAFCKEAENIGNAPLHPNARPRKVTVFLNPAAQGGKARKMFEKNVAPILYLAGLEVSVIKTEYEGQAKGYMDVIDDTDAIIVAGGDGTLLETITGLLRRADDTIVQKIPIGIIPLGGHNTLANLLLNKDSNLVRWLADCAMAVVKGVTKPIDVLKIQSESGKTVFAVTGLRWGTYSDAEKRTKKYWFVGPLKHRFTYLMSCVKQWPPLVKAQFSYVFTCDGCSVCRKPPPAPQWRWWHFLMPPKVEVTEDFSSVINEDCGTLHDMDMSSFEFSLRSSNYALHEQQNKRCMDVYIAPELERTEMVKEGWRRMKESVNFNENQDENLKIYNFKLQPEITEGTDTWFYIDNEQYEAMPIEVSLLKNKLNIFTVPEKIHL